MLGSFPGQPAWIEAFFRRPESYAPGRGWKHQRFALGARLKHAQDCAVRQAVLDLVCPDVKIRQVVGAERGNHRHVCRVRAADHEDAAGAGYVVAGVKGLPRRPVVHL